MPERRSAIPWGPRTVLTDSGKIELGVARRHRAGALAFILLALVGCGPKSDRLAVSGAVALDGTPLDNGAIRFSSIGGEKIMSSGALIQGGAYNIPQEKGLLPGPYHIEINSPNTTARPILDRPSGMLVAPERIPAAYNVDSQQTIEVTADGDNQFDFNIGSEPTK